jgi:hypothetical protein
MYGCRQSSVKIDGVAEAGRQVSFRQAKFGFSRTEYDPLVCITGNKDQLFGHYNEVGSNYNYSRRSMLGNISGCTVSAVAKEKKQRLVGKGYRPNCRHLQALLVGPITPGILPPNCLQPWQVTCLGHSSTVGQRYSNSWILVTKLQYCNGLKVVYCN